MILRNCLAAGVAALAMLVAAPDASAKGRSYAAARPAGGRTIVASKTVVSKTFVAPKTVVGGKTVVGTKTVVASKTLALKPAFVKGFNGKTIQTSLYGKTFGVKTKGGFIAYKGLKHGQWSRKWYCGTYRCWMWYCPCACDWYYWCDAYGAYLPMRYLPVAGPAAPIDGVTPELPPGANDVPTANGGEMPVLPKKAGKVEAAKNNKIADLPEPE